MRRRTLLAAAAATVAAPAIAFAQTENTEETEMSATTPTTGYVDVNGLHMYYESHGQGGVPLVVLHGAFSSIHNSFGMLIPELSKTRRVIGFDLQGHGRTADIDRPMFHPLLADDVFNALEALGIEQADVWGYSNGSAVALNLAIKHPEKVRKLIVHSATYRLDGVHAGLMEGLGEMQPSMMYGSPWHTDYMALNPKPDFDTLFHKKTEADKALKDFTDEEIKGIEAPVMIVAGDSDLPTIEHLARFFRLLGAGVFGDTPAGLPRSQLAILPGTSHISAVYRPELLLPMIPAFLDKQETAAAA
jgi:pimeloyl-ACP methyl ester carboxylesterase